MKTPPKRRAKVIVVGAGLAGLRCGRVLRRTGLVDVDVLEATAMVGGRARTRAADAARP